MAKSPDSAEIWAPRLIKGGMGLMAIAIGIDAIGSFFDNATLLGVSEAAIAVLIFRLAGTVGNGAETIDNRPIL